MYFVSQRGLQGHESAEKLRFWLLVFARCVILWSHYTGRPLPLSGPTVVVKVIVVVGCGCGHLKHFRHVEVHICRQQGRTEQNFEGRQEKHGIPGRFVEFFNP